MSKKFSFDKDKINIGVISDTHGLLRTEALRYVKESDLILHAGDIGDPAIIKKLNEFAPVAAVKGNIDDGPGLKKFPATEIVEINTIKIFLIHNISDLNFNPGDKKINAVIYGHSHKPDIKKENNIIFFNPGSAGRKRFNLPVSVGQLYIFKNNISAKIINIENHLKI